MGISPGTRLGIYEVVGAIGAGGMGEVYRAVRAGFRVVETPYVFTPRQSGESKTATNPLGYVMRGWNYVVTIARLRAI